MIMALRIKRETNYEESGIIQGNIFTLLQFFLVN